MIDWILSFWDKGLLGGKRNSGWWRLRKEYARLHPTCEATGSKKRLEVHHIYPVHLYPEKEMDIDNLIILTKWMHFWLAHFGSYYSYNLNIREDSAKLLEKIKNRP